MTKKEVLELFKFFKSVYQHFEVDQYKIDTWAELLEDQDFEVVMRKAKKHAREYKFPPAVAELITIKPPKNEFIEKYRQWEREAKNAERIRHSG